MHGYLKIPVPVAAVFENLEDGVTIDEVVELYAGLTRDHVKAILDFAARSLAAPRPAADADFI